VIDLAIFKSPQELLPREHREFSRFVNTAVPILIFPAQKQNSFQPANQIGP
jgi:hypothetical protein